MYTFRHNNVSSTSGFRLRLAKRGCVRCGFGTLCALTETCRVGQTTGDACVAPIGADKSTAHEKKVIEKGFEVSAGDCSTDRMILQAVNILILCGTPAALTSVSQCPSEHWLRERN